MRCSVQRATAKSRLDHDSQGSQRCDNPVSLGKGALIGLHPRRVLGDYQPLLGDGSVQLTMPNGIRDVDPRAQNGDGVATFLERGPVGGGVDAARHSADYRHSGADERPRQHPRCALAVAGAVARPNDSYARFGQGRVAADCVQLTRWLRDRAELRRKLFRLLIPAMDGEFRLGRRSLK